MLINTSNVNFFKIRLAHSCKIPTTIGVLISLLCTGYFYVMKSEIEIWKPVTISPFEGLYEVSNFARVKKFQRLINDKIGTVRTQKEFILKQSNVKGYKAVCLFNSHDIRKQIKVHRIVALHFVDNPNNYPEINHLDGNKANNHDWNLEWATQSINTIHAYKIGLMNTDGSKNGGSKLTEKDVIKMRKAYAKELVKIKDLYYRGRKMKGFYFAEKLAKKYNMNPKTIYSILIKESWTHI